ncbi:MAG TPA: VIT1/CCC1 transporter family protein [Gemmatimonadaceae bacterium]|jgi:VIT1/CCC1 family predicted Fe2+/Mn2+ transporter
MAAPGATTTVGTAADRDTFQEHWQDEGDAAFLYRELARAEPDPHRKNIFERLAAVEDEHQAIWQRVLQDNDGRGSPVGPFRPSARARLMALVGRSFGAQTLLNLLLREEGREVKAYLDLHRTLPSGGTGSAEALQLARESATHATELATLTHGEGAGEPWHRIASGGFLRNVVYGFNDGLTANFGLVAGVLGASSNQQHSVIIMAGVAGLVADALSMGSSGYLAAKSEQEVYAHEIAMERDEIAMMPELERDELALLYEARGVPAETARELAASALRDPARMLDEKVRMELGIGERTMSPLREGWVTGVATAFGALIPVAPFFFLTGSAAIWTAFVIAMASHFLVGAARSVFTGRGVFRSGFDMFVVGLGVAAVGYMVGEWISRVLGT